MSNTALVLVPTIDPRAVSLSPSIKETVQQMTARIAGVKTIADDFDAELATTLYVEAADLIKRCEASRVEVKRPFLEVERKIDAVMKELFEDVKNDLVRVKRMIEAHAAQKRKEAEAAEAARLAELARIEEEKRKLSVVAPPEVHADGWDSVEQSAAEANAEMAELDARKKALASQPVKAALPSAISSSRPTWDYEVTDIHKLYAANRMMVRLEPAKDQINDAIKRGMRECPGLRIFESNKVSFKRL